MPSARLLPEAETSFKSRGGESAGPDWIALQGSQGLALECTIGSVPLVARTEGDIKEVAEALRKHYASRMNKLPQKMVDATCNRPDLRLGAVTQWHYVVVYKE